MLFLETLVGLKFKSSSSITNNNSGFISKNAVKKVSFEGIGLHSGKSSKVHLFPADENHGIVFKRIDLKINNLIKTNFANVTQQDCTTTLENNYGGKFQR